MFKIIILVVLVSAAYAGNVAPAVAPVVRAPLAAHPLPAPPLAAVTPVFRAPYAASNFVAAPLGAAPLAATHFAGAPLETAPVFRTPYAASPFAAAPFAAAPFLRAAPVAAAPWAAAPLAAAPVAPVPIANVAVPTEYDPAPQYSYGYDVQDGLTGDSKTHYETRTADGVVQGSYSLIDSDGTRRIVDYVADPVNGFNAVVRKEPLVVAAPAALAATPVHHAKEYLG